MPAYDELTGLLTRAAFLEQLDEFARAGGTLIVIHADLDHMMRVNDQYGHQAGDEWIKTSAGRFRQAFDGDAEAPALVARYGGDELLAVVRSADLFKIYEQADRLRHSFEQDPPALTVNGQEVRPGNTLSLGLASLSSASDPVDLLEKGKAALYRAKQSGGNRVCFYQETDTLTGLLNFYASQRTLEEGLSVCKKRGEPLSILFIDIDNFKEINDEYGHRAGDEVLKRLSHILENNFNASGESGGVARFTGKDSSAAAAAVGRVAGDEFLVILPGQHADSAFVLAEEVRRLVEDSPITVRLDAGQDHTRTLTVRFSISGGVAAYPSDATERVDLLRKADEALYRSKHIGRNRISLPASAQMITKTSYYTQIQLERLAALARKMDKTEAFLLREALDDLLRKYDPAAQG